MANELTNAINQQVANRQQSGTSTSRPQSNASAGRINAINAAATQAANNPNRVPQSYTISTTSGKQYTVDRNQMDWIKSRYKQDWAGTYGVDDADQYAYKNGQMSAKWRKTYGNSNVDRQLAEMGLPSEKNLEKYIAEYQNWHTGGISDYFGKDVPQNFYTKTKEMFKGDWQYDDTQEDQLRKSSGQMPSKLAAKYTDTEIDDELRAAGLPPVAEMGKYIGRYNNYSAIDNLYKNAAVAWANLGISQDDNGQYIQNDNKLYTVNGLTRKGKDLYADAFYDEMGRKDANGNDVYGSIYGLFKNNHLEENPDDYDGTNYNQYRGKQFANAAKVADLADDYAAYTAFSYDDFAGKYGDYYDKYLKSYKFSDGQTLEEKMKGIAIKNDEQAQREFYDVSDKWFDKGRGTSDFVARYKQMYPSNTYEQMFKDMFENGVAESTIAKTMRTLRRDTSVTGGKNNAEDKNSGFNDITDAFYRAKQNFKSEQRVNEEAIAAEAEELTSEDAVRRIEDYMSESGGWTAENATKAIDALVEAGVDAGTIKDAVADMRARFGDSEYKDAMDALGAYELKEAGAEAFDEFTVKKYQKELRAAQRDARKQYAEDEATIQTAYDAIDKMLTNLITTDEGVASVNDVIAVLDSIESASWNNPVSMEKALERYGFVGNGQFTGLAEKLTKNWSNDDKLKLFYNIGSVRTADVSPENNDFIEKFTDIFGGDWLKFNEAPVTKRSMQYADFSSALDWAKEQIANGTLIEAQAYQVLSAEGYSPELEQYVGEDWHRAVYEDLHVPMMLQQAGGAQLAMWEGMTPDERKKMASDMYDSLSAEEKAAMFGDADWWKSDPTVYRTFGQAFEQQFAAILPSLATDLIASGAELGDMIGASFTGRPELNDSTKDWLKMQEFVQNYGSVYDDVNGTKVADVAASVVGEIARMQVLGMVGAGVGSAFEATGIGGKVAQLAAGNPGIVKKATGMALSLVRSSPFVANAWAHDYAELKSLGASNSEAMWNSMITGMAEGVLEGFNFDSLWGKVLGQEAFATEILDAGKRAFGTAGIVWKARIANMAASGLGEFTEESIGYVLDTYLKMRHSDTWGKGTEWSASDWLSQAGMGFLVGAIGGGMASMDITANRILADYAMSSEEGLRAVFPDVVTSDGIWDNASEIVRASYETGGATVLSSDAYKQLNEQAQQLVASAQKTLEQARADEADAQEKINNAESEVRKLQDKIAPYLDKGKQQSMTGEEAKEFASMYAKWNEAVRHLAAVRNEVMEDLAEKAGNHERSLQNAESQLKDLQKKIQEHFCGIHLMNEGATPEQAYANLMNAYQNGFNVEGKKAQATANVQNRNVTVDAEQAAGYNNSAREVNTNGSQGTEAGAGNEGQPGQYAGVPGQTFSGDNQVLSGEGRNGRANSRWFESVPITEKARANGIDPVDLRTDNNDPSSFYTAIGDAKASNDHGAFVDQHSVDEYGNMQTFMSDDGGVGVAVTDDGDIVSVFKNPEKNQSKKSSTSILFTALENGGKKLDNFNSNVLSQIYLQHGFIPVARIAFNDDYAPDGWNYERDGRPDILFWVHNGDDADTILEKMGTYEMPDVESLPLFEGENAYDEAANYRNSLVDENAGWTQQTAQSEQAPVRRLSDDEVAKVQQTLKELKFKNEVRFIDDPNEADGWIDDNGNITINRTNISEAEAKELADNPGWWVLKHELAHFTEGTAEYDEYSGIVKRIIQRRIGDQGYISAINDIKSEYAQRGQTLDTPLAERELVAKFMQSGELLSNQESIEMFVREQGNLADRIYNWIRYKIDDLKLRRRPNSALARDMLKAERLYAQAYRKANRNPGRDNGVDGRQYAIRGEDDNRRRLNENNETTQMNGSSLSGAPLSGGSNNNTTQNDGFANGQNRTLSSGSSWDEILQKYGAQPKGRTPRASDERVPNRVDDDTRVSRLGRSLYESPHMTDDMRAEARDMMVNQNWLSYTPTTNEESMTEARNYIAARQPLAAQQEFHDMVMQGKLSRKTNAIGLQLLADASARGDVDSFYAIATDLQIAATEAGQSAQIFNVLKELKGVGSAYYMQRVVDRLNAKYDDQIQQGKMQRITVSPVLMEQLSQARTVDQITEAEEAVAKEIAAQVPLTWADRLSSWRYFSMLGNPTTHIRNMTGNLLMKGLNAAKDAVATGIESVGNVDQSQRAHAVLTGADRSMWGDFADTSYNEQARNLSGGGKLGFETFVKQNMRSFDTRWLDALAKFNFNALESEDIMFIRPAYKNALMQYMKAQGYTLNEKGQAGKVDAKGVFHEMTNAQHTAAVEWASEQAWKQTFRDASSLATMLNKLSKEGTVAKLLVEGVMPFKKTPINIAKRGLEYSPAGIIMGTVQLATKVKQGKMSAATAIDNLSSGITGTALMALGVFLAKAGLIRAGGEDKKKYETYLEDTGDQTYSFKFGNVSINMSSIAPATIPLFMGVALQEMASQNDGDVDLSAITDMAAGTLNPFMEMSFMSSLNSALQNYSSNGIGGALGNTLLTAAENYGSQYLPTLGGKVGQFLDPTRRTTKSDATSPIGGNLDYYVRSLAKKVPGLESTLQADVDVWGRTDTKDSFGDWALDFANKFILPTNVKVSNRDAVDRELIRVVESTGVVDFLPSDGNKYFTVKGERYNMNAKQYKEFSEARGQAAYAAIKDVMASPAYANASDEAKADMLNKAKEAAYKQVNNLWKDKLGAFDK